MQAKLRQLMKHEGINSTRLAEMLGIQASGISHIMSGRNKPSFDFLLKLLGRFPQINPDWLLLDRGPMYRDEIKQKTGAGNSGGTQRAESAGRFGGPGGSEGTNTTDSMGVFGVKDAARGLFGPDNNDIISAGYSGEQPGGDHTGHPGTPPGTPPDLQQRAQQTPQQLIQPQQPQPPQQSAQPPVYQSGGFTKSASIERIVVFYKDKTFSEYQPE